MLIEVDRLKDPINQYDISPHEEESFKQDFNLRYTHESNIIEWNTLTLMETKIVLEGVTIGGKSLREHFEVINHHSAIDFIERLVRHKHRANKPISLAQHLSEVEEYFCKSPNTFGTFLTLTILL